MNEGDHNQCLSLKMANVNMKQKSGNRQCGNDGGLIGENLNSKGRNEMQINGMEIGSNTYFVLVHLFTVVI